VTSTDQGSGLPLRKPAHVRLGCDMDLGSRFHTLGPLGLAFALQHANHEPFTLSSHLAAPSFPICKLFPAASDQLYSGNPSCVAGT
jgi:predicted cupin superfamily sugar epimerase